jgi:D-alanine-D-alanine ligase
MSKTRLLVLFGGITVEHEVSVITGVQLLKHVDREKYEPTPVYIDKSGAWWTGESLFSIDTFKPLDLYKPTGLESFSLNLNAGSNPYDAAILCFHGAYGEAGNVQGLLELVGIPYQGPGVVGSAINFDKIVTRQVFTAENLPQTKYIWFTAEEWENSQSECVKKIESLSYPVFVKPANGGSTIGIEKVSDPSKLVETVNRVKTFDNRILVEAEVKDCIEVNVSVLGLGGDSMASVPEQPIKADEFLSFADKYERGGGKKSGMASANRRIPAPISSSLTQKLQDLAQHIFKVMDCSGVVRIDFFVDPSEERICITELNTIPGSMSYYLWQATGVQYPELIDRLVAIAKARFARQKKLVTSFESNILNQAAN